jgi:uncharacterized integral membrane protein
MKNDAKYENKLYCFHDVFYKLQTFLFSLLYIHLFIYNCQTKIGYICRVQCDVLFYVNMVEKFTQYDCYIHNFTQVLKIYSFSNLEIYNFY